MNNLKLNFKKLIIFLIINFILIFLISLINFNSIKAKLNNNNNFFNLEKQKEKELSKSILSVEPIPSSILEKQNSTLKKEITTNEDELTKLKKNQEYKNLILQKRREGNLFHRTLYFFKGLYNFMEEDWKSSFLGISTIIIIFLIIILILS
ncbi:MAG: hypothetical protein ACLTFB_02415 [Candidatus Phytoplasma pyri]|uniref:hypothetical protein n=1 Tax=Candidatus Phytoplasma pyri TaxID=47566 RepID=UPI003982FC80